ncbi:hypothetical protein AMTR_s00032p00158290 [Amborella trichopoda]|uniref:Uncharacterized protein n=1 Tax=Amborella trichopoda TaxID=13333 RepID=U5CY17_AMBTC|nr:hypothetical protein AMTR_s00032p00158290 [Amborella trichopoda]
MEMQGAEEKRIKKLWVGFKQNKRHLRIRFEMRSLELMLKNFAWWSSNLCGNQEGQEVFGAIFGNLKDREGFGHVFGSKREEGHLPCT